MEDRRRSIRSKYESLEKKASGKMKAPLAMVFSFNDNDVHPDCPNIANPYHKCGRHCLDKIPAGRKYLDAIRSGWDKERVKKLEKGVNPNCPFASNPYHECDEYCLKKLLGKRQEAGKDRTKKPRGAPKKAVEKKVHLNRSASDLNKLTVYIFEDIPKKEHLKGDMKSKQENEIYLTTQRELSSLCKNASKPYHVCDEYCFQSVPEREQYGQAIKPKESKIVVGVEQGTKFDGRSASNSDYEPAENVFQSVPERELHRPKKTKGASFKIEKSSPLPDNKHISNPYHEVIEDCFDDNPEQEYPNGVVKSNEESIVVTTEQGVDLLCKYSSNHYHESLTKSMEKEAVVPLERVNPRCKRASNPYHVCAKYCFQNVFNGHHPVHPIVKLKEEKKVTLSPQAVNLDCKYTSNPYHVCAEYCLEKVLERDPPKQTIKKFKEDDTEVLSKRRVNPDCKFASNPYHACAEYCFQNAVEEKQQGQERAKRVSFKFEKSCSLPDNKHILNPCHEVIEDRFDDNPEKEHPNRVVKPRIVVTIERGVDLLCKYSSNHHHESLVKSMEKEAVVPLERVNPQCKRALNPYHVCVEYCFQNVFNGHHPVQPIKKFEEEDREVLFSERRVNPDCKFASNPYHACAEYCFQNAVEGKRKEQVLKEKSLKELKNLVSNKKIASENPHCQYSSNPYHECAKYCFNKNVPVARLLDRVMKTNERKKEDSHAHDNPKYKNASKSFNRCSEYSPEETSLNIEEGSTVTINKNKRNSSQGNKQNLSITEKKISLNSTYMEAAKPDQNYVESPERIILQDGTEKRGSMDEHKDMQSVGIGEISKKINGQGNCDSENFMEKVEATGGFSCSLSILLLLILLAGFLLGLN